MQHKGTKCLETKRLILRPFQIEDYSSVYTNWASDSEVTKYLTWNPHASKEVSKDYVQFCIDGYKDEKIYQWGIELKETRELIGNISVVHVDDSIDSVELGWVIGRAWWGNGYMSEAASQVVKFLFNEVKVNRIAARHDVNNPKSGRVMQKIGMKYEGTLRQCDRNNQGVVDCVYYSILKEEYL